MSWLQTWVTAGESEQQVSSRMERNEATCTPLAAARKGWDGSGGATGVGWSQQAELQAWGDTGRAAPVLGFWAKYGHRQPKLELHQIPAGISASL